MLDAMTGAPAFVRNGRMDILAANRLGRALYSEMFDIPPAREHRPVHLPRPARAGVLRRLGAGRDRLRRDPALRSRAHPYDRDLSDLVGELSTQSELFRTRWAAHNVRYHDTGTKRFHHPVVGDLT